MNQALQFVVLLEAEEFKFKFQGIELAVRQKLRCPNRPTLVFLHDSLGCIQLWRDFPDRLAETVHCNFLIYDRFGYGRSDQKAPLVERGIDYLEVEAKVLNELILQRNVKDPIYFGHSDGGSIALIAGALNPDLPLAIITEGAHIFVEEITLAGIREVKQTYDTTDLKERLAKYHGEHTEDVFHSWIRTWLRPEFRDWNIEQFLASIQCPVLAIQGIDDEFGSIEQVNGIVNQVSGQSNAYLVPDAKHTPHKEAQESTLERASDFIHSLFNEYN